MGEGVSSGNHVVPSPYKTWSPTPHSSRPTTPQLKMSAFASSTWASIPKAPPNPIFNLTTRYKADADARKLNLGVGAYRDANGLPYVFKAVRDAEALINDLQSKGEMNHEYLSITGDGGFGESRL